MLGIIIGLVLLMFLAYKGMSIIWIAPICAMIVALTGGLELLPAYTDAYMGGFVGFAKSWFPVFMLGAIFGKVMDDSGAARSVATWVTKIIGTKFAIMAVVLACAVLTYGGVSLFVVVFAIYPLAVALFREANITRKLIPGAIALGSFTFTMTATPGTPQIQNLIPTNYFGTTAMAAPIMGTVGALIMFGGGMAWLMFREKGYAKAGVGFTELDKKLEEVDESTLPNPLLSALPLVAVITTLNVFNLNIITALIIGIVLGIALNFARLPKLVETINAGASGSVIAIINTSAAVGFGAVVRAVPGFTTLTDLVLGIKGNPLISEAVAVNVLAGATGSASGGMGIALEALGEKYVQLSIESGIPLEAFHRIASMSSGGLDTLPHNGAVLTLLAVTSMTHKDSYKDIFVVGSLIPIASVIAGILLASVGII
ncbi:H+/gluconate symporter-like permease [Acetoanaerobium pronyense]|uniref:H+/gluconate symporter-like permease n=1 Tax=Acetoanaerobium pronyense TaxID=1482736 RepID=A0ABS4KHF8_9FIRM|nr:GntP family permease [Acetoanaerobium pronyense]MBP2027223.1 H+/gluconate symporter-like permease [Acetoanaerobium pronyense]